ncbi:hypothetical protein WJX72_010339 [[Myrmecia] bisecta]|uniref:Uncharacterized protein n=1 Tax=[Myrmecia] bisecta TaxID=41462 RepID=A0AAW1PPV9_9CHLO
MQSFLGDIYLSLADANPHDDRQHLLRKRSLRVLSLSVLSFYRAGTHPYVVDKLKKFLKPILGLSAATLLLGLILHSLVSIVAVVVQVCSLGLISRGLISRGFARWVEEAVTFVPVAAMLLMRGWLRKPLAKCFIHMLRDINAPLAAQIETSPGQRTPQGKHRSQERSLGDKIARLLLLSFLTYIWRSTPVIGVLAAPVMHFLSSAKALGPRRAAVISGLALYPPLAPWVLRLVDIYRLSRVLGAELLQDYTRTMVPDTDDFWRENQLTVVVFLTPQLALLSIPVIGPLLYVPIQGAAAWLVDLLDKEAANPQLYWHPVAWQQTMGGRTEDSHIIGACTCPMGLTVEAR